MPHLFDRRLLVFTGKGGAGKSTAAAAAAVAASRRGTRVLMVEIGEQERLSSIFQAPKVGYAGGRVYAGRGPGSAPIWAMCLTAREALHEFALHSMKFETLYSAVFENRAMRYFTAAAPGLEELIVMGKIEFLHRESRVGPNGPPFDALIFDAPATGHGLAFFSVPRTAMNVTRMGPLHARAERMWRMLADPTRTALHIVTLPEEMSASEAIDLHFAAETMGLPRGVLVVNRVHPDAFPGEHDELRALRDRVRASDAAAGRVARAALDRALSSVARRDADEAAIERLAHALPRPRIVLPRIVSAGIGPAELETLADAFEAGAR